MSTAEQNGLEWSGAVFGLEPRWTREPKVEIIERLARKHLELDDGRLYELSFYAAGAFNKLYRVVCTRGKFLMRVSLPVDPHSKTRSEAVTIRFVRQKTQIPVPTIIAFDDSNDNELGFEWMLMELMPGRPLREQWRQMSVEAKRDLVRHVALYHAQLSCITPRFRGIGNIFLPPEKEWKNEPVGSSEDSDQEFPLGHIVSVHINQDVPRGPFRTSHDWLRAQLAFTLNDQDRILKESDDISEIKGTEYAKGLAQRLLEMLASIFPPEEDIPEETVLWHHDLSLQNILVDEAGDITAVVDWECISTMPLWVVPQFPQFLMGMDREAEPVRDEYGDESEDDDEEARDEGLDNEGKNELYWIHQMEYEQTQLRQLYSAEMERLWPQWKTGVQEGAQKADFELAVSCCSTQFGTALVQDWPDGLQDGEYWSLRAKLME